MSRSPAVPGPPQLLCDRFLFARPILSHTVGKQAPRGEVPCSSPTSGKWVSWGGTQAQACDSRVPALQALLTGVPLQLFGPACT